MKKLIIVEVPDGWFISSVHKAPIYETGEYFNEGICMFTELIPPTDEEKDKAAINYCNQFCTPINGDLTDETAIFEAGIEWTLKKLGYDSKRND